MWHEDLNEPRWQVTLPTEVLHGEIIRFAAKVGEENDVDGVPQWSQLNKDQTGWEKGTESKICWDWSERKWTLSIHSVAGVYEILVDEDDDAHAYEPPLTGWVGQFGLEGMPAPLVEDCILIEEERRKNQDSGQGYFTNRELKENAKLKKAEEKSRKEDEVMRSKIATERAEAQAARRTEEEEARKNQIEEERSKGPGMNIKYVPEEDESTGFGNATDGESEDSDTENARASGADEADGADGTAVSQLLTVDEEEIAAKAERHRLKKEAQKDAANMARMAEEEVRRKKGGCSIL